VAGRKPYLTVFLMTAAILFAGVWVVTSTLRWGFLETEYGTWRAKLDMIDRCELGEVIILGESRASSGFIPRLFRADVTNFALSGTGPIEADYEVRRIFRCPRMPKTAVLAFAPQYFKLDPYFWSRSARFGLFSYADLEEIRKTEQETSKGFFYQDAFGSEPPGPIKNWLYINHFPPFELGNLIGSVVAGRLHDSRRAYRDTLEGRGWHPMRPIRECAERPAPIDPTFSPNPLIDRYFVRLIDDLHSHGIAILIIEPPISEVSAQATTAEFQREYAAYLSDRSMGRYATPTTEQLFPVRPNCEFSDNSHLSQKGAREFSIGVDDQISAKAWDESQTVSTHRKNPAPIQN
jgi:hypothetical protein